MSRLWRWRMRSPRCWPATATTASAGTTSTIFWPSIWRHRFRGRTASTLRHGHPVAEARLWWAAEEAKKRLSAEPEVTVREEALVSRDGVPLHLELEVTREEYEAMIRPLVERTLESVSKAMHDAGKTARDLDTILLVGGSTRTPLVSRLLHERTGIQPREEIQPDLCVALGAGCWLRGWPATTWSECWWMFLHIRLVFRILANVGAPPMTIAIKPIIRPKQCAAFDANGTVLYRRSFSRHGPCACFRGRR